MIIAIFLLIILITSSMINDYHVTTLLIIPLYIFAEMRYLNLKDRVSELEMKLGKKEDNDG